MDDCVHELIFFLSKNSSYSHVESASFAMLAHLPTIFVLASYIAGVDAFEFFSERRPPYQAEKKACQSEDPVGKGSTMLPTVLGKMADFGE